MVESYKKNMFFPSSYVFYIDFGSFLVVKLMGYLALFYVRFFKCLLNIRATALIFELNQAVYSIYMEFQYESSSPINE